jgi:hypothetical protein
MCKCTKSKIEGHITMDGGDPTASTDEPVKFESNSHKSSTYKCIFLAAYYYRAPTLDLDCLRMSLGTPHKLVACKLNKKSRGRITHGKREESVGRQGRREETWEGCEA